MISARPAEADDRAVPGHWEGDLIIGKDGASAIGTLVEHSTRFVLLLHLPGDHSAEAVRDAMLAKIDTLPAQLWRSLTWDQGTEMARHGEITLAAELPIYFWGPLHYSASTSPKAATYPPTPPTTSTPSPPNSTNDPARHSTGTPQPKPCPNYCRPHQPPALRRPPELKHDQRPLV